MQNDPLLLWAVFFPIVKTSTHFINFHPKATACITTQQISPRFMSSELINSVSDWSVNPAFWLNSVIKSINK